MFSFIYSWGGINTPGVEIVLTDLSVSRGRPPLHQRLLDWKLEAAGAFGGGKDGDARKGSVEVSGGLLDNADPYSAIRYIGLPTSKAGQDHNGPRTLAPGCGLGWKTSRGAVQRRNTKRDIIIFHV